MYICKMTGRSSYQNITYLLIIYKIIIIYLLFINKIKINIECR